MWSITWSTSCGTIPTSSRNWTWWPSWTANYVSCGFQSCKKFSVCLEGGKFPSAMMVKELREGALDGREWVYRDSPVMSIDEEEARRYDDTLAPMAREYRPSQEEFYIMSHSCVVEG